MNAQSICRHKKISQSTLRTNHVRAVVFVVRFTHFALQTRFDLSANTDAISDLHSRDLVADFDGFANDLMTNANW